MTDAPAAAGSERRLHPRFDLMAQVRVKHGKVDYIMELSNISVSGAFMHLGKLDRPSWIAIERMVEVGIVHPVELDTIEVQGQIVRINEDVDGLTAAVNFVDLDDDRRAGIARLVQLGKRQSESPPKPPPLPR
jgi:hypothetical protein